MPGVAGPYLVGRYKIFYTTYDRYGTVWYLRHSLGLVGTPARRHSLLNSDIGAAEDLGGERSRDSGSLG